MLHSTAFSFRYVLRLLVLACLVVLISSTASAQLIISEFRLRGPSGANDEFVEVMNNSNVPVTVAAISGTGFAIAASDGTVRCSIPNGTVIPARGHYLCTNSVAYSISGYPAGTGTATGNATFAIDIPDNAGIALFNNNTGGGSFTLANRLDAVGSTSEANTLYKEGAGYPALTPFSIDYNFVRDVCGKNGSNATFGPCPRGGFALDTNDNATDFYFNDTNGTSAGAGQRLGAPGPKNLFSPIFNGAGINSAPLDPCVTTYAPPNFVRDFTSDSLNNSTFGTIDLRRTFTNNTGSSITRLRFRVIDLTTFPAPSGVADLRPRTSSAVSVAGIDRPPCGSGTSTITVQGTTLEQPPPQPNGGGWNSSLGAGTVTLGTPLANGASIDVRFLCGIQQTGNYKFSVMVESLPAGGSLLEFSGNTECAYTFTPVAAAFTNAGGPGSVSVTQITGTCSYTAVSNNSWIVINSGGGAAIGNRTVTYTVNPTTLTADRVGSINIGSQTFTVRQDGVIAGRGDFNGDGKTDILLRNATTGEIGMWIMNGAAITTGASVGSPGGTYTVAGVGDFNGDGKADILLRDSLGNIGMWIMNGATITTGAFVGSPGAYSVAAVGDLNGDGKADIVLRDSLGAIGVWIMNGATITSGALIGPTAGYSVIAATDFNADGKADILLRDSFGSLGLWIMNGAIITSGGAVGSLGTSTVVGVADYNSDAKADILLRDNLGNLGIWFMNGATISSGAAIGSLGVFNVAGVGNYNGVGSSDILLRSQATGDVGMWLMTGATISSGGSVGPLTSAFEIR